MDPLSLAGRADAASMLAAELPEHPVWQAQPGVIHVVGYDACRAALLDHERFSSDASRFGPAGLGGSAAPPRTMNAVDPPEHTKSRSIVAEAFTRKAVAARVPGLAITADRILAPLVELGSFHVVRDFAGPYVQEVLASMLGLSPDSAGEMQKWSDALTSPKGRHEVEQARRQLGGLFAEHLDQPKDLPQGSLLRTLQSACGHGLLSREQLLATCVLLAQAGAETTRNTLASMVITLSEQPELLKALRGSSQERNAVVGEALRFHSSVAAAVRYTTRDTSLAGTRLDGRCPVFVWISAANRDPSTYVRPQLFDASRPRPHLALGAGAHICLGAHLARAQLSTALGALAARVDHLVLDGPVIWLPSPLARGPQHATVVCTARHSQRGAFG